MNKQGIINGVLTLLQGGLGFAVLWTVYMIFALLDSDFGIDGWFGLMVIQPLLGCVLSALMLAVCFISGLPLHFNRSLNRWWKKHGYLSLVLFLAGAAALVLSLLPALAEEVKITIDGYETTKNIPDKYLFLTGWYLSGFSALHLYPALFSGRARTVICVVVAGVMLAAAILTAAFHCFVHCCRPDDRPFNRSQDRSFNQADRNRRDVYYDDRKFTVHDLMKNHVPQGMPYGKGTDLSDENTSGT
ncbi:MAG: hypothetical protein LBH90_08205 [Tannerella sp.]|jgi:hypothetical protein|nr:hypothetical protein [Tannerella sp.]